MLSLSFSIASSHKRHKWGTPKPREKKGRIQCDPIAPQHCTPFVSEMPLCSKVTMMPNRSWAESAMLYEIPAPKIIADSSARALASANHNLQQAHSTVSLPEPSGNSMETQSIPFHREPPHCSALTKPTSHPNPDPDPGNH